MKLAFESRFSLPINGVDYTVGIATREAFDGLKDVSEVLVEGFTDTSRALIIIAEDTPDSRRTFVFWHEYIHAAFGEGGDQVFAALAGCEVEEATDCQERLCRFLGPILATTLGGPQAIYDLLAGPIDAPRTGRKKTGATQTRPEGRNKGTTRR